MQGDLEFSEQIRQGIEPEWQIRLALSNFALMEYGYDEGELINSEIYQKAMDVLEKNGFNPRENLLEYTYLRHNAGIKEIIDDPKPYEEYPPKKQQVQAKLQFLKRNSKFVQELNGLSNEIGKKYHHLQPELKQNEIQEQAFTTTENGVERRPPRLEDIQMKERRA